VRFFLEALVYSTVAYGTVAKDAGTSGASIREASATHLTVPRFDLIWVRCAALSKPFALRANGLRVSGRAAVDCFGFIASSLTLNGSTLFWTPLRLQIQLKWPAARSRIRVFLACSAVLRRVAMPRFSGQQPWRSPSQEYDRVQSSEKKRDRKSLGRK